MLCLGCLGLGVTACNPGLSSEIIDATSQPLPVEQGKDFTDGYTNSTERAVSSISLDDVISAVSLPTQGANLTIRDLTRQCRSVEGGSKDDSDNDDVPEEIKYRYDPQICKGEIPGGKRTVNGKSEIRNEDRGGYRETLDVTVTDTFNDGRVVTERRTGTAKLTQFSKRFEKFFDLRISRRVNNQPEFLLENKLVYNFVPNGPTEARINKELPAGSVSVAGETRWVQGQNLARKFQVSSPTALTYDPSCGKKGQSITGGTETLNQSGKIVKITYGACGIAPTVQFDPK
jgi:hypothetical protein